VSESDRDAVTAGASQELYATADGGVGVFEEVGFDAVSVEDIPGQELGSAVAKIVADKVVSTTPSKPHVVNYKHAPSTRLPKVLLLHTGGTLGMDAGSSFEVADNEAAPHLKKGTGGQYDGGLQPGEVLADIMEAVPEISCFADIQCKILFNLDSCRVGPNEWLLIARALDASRKDYDGFVVIHGTDTLSYTSSAVSLLLAGFGKPIIFTGSQLPLNAPRSDARQNLIDAISVAGLAELTEVCVCFGGKLMRGNRTQKTHSSAYGAFSSPTYPELGTLGVDVDLHREYLLDPFHKRDGSLCHYSPRFRLVTCVVRIPIVPGCDPSQAYGDLYGRGVRGIVLEAFGVGNMPDTIDYGWIPWLVEQREQGLMVYITSQCLSGALQPELYRSGLAAIEIGCEGGPRMTPECAVVKMMLVLAHPELKLQESIAGEL